MITATKSSINFTKTSLDLNNKANTVKETASKSNLESYNLRGSEKAKSKESNKYDFSKVLESKSKEKHDDVSNVDKYKKDDNYEKVDEVNEETEELEEKRKLSKDKIDELLNSILNLLNKIGNKDESLNLNNDDNSYDSDLSTLMNKLLESLKNDSAKDSLDNDSLSTIKNLLNQLSEDIGNYNGQNKNNIKSLMTELSDLMKSTQGDKVLSLEDILKNNLSQDNGESLNGESNENSFNEATEKNSSVSKENKFLNSLLDEDKDSTLNRMNLLASKIPNNVQGQVINTKQEMVVNKTTFTNDLIQDVKYMANNSIKELIVKVNPGNLGEITIKLIQEDGVMKANLKSNSKETTALLSQNLLDIKKQLTEQNIKISDVNIELYQDDTTFFKQDGFDRGFSQEQGRNQSNNRNGINEISHISGNDNSIDEVEEKDDSNVNFLA